MITSDFDIAIRRRRILWLYSISVVAAMCWNILPRVPVWQAILPDGVLIVLLFWTIDDDTPRGLWQVFVIGLLVDLVMGSLLGMHAFGYLIIIFIANRWRKVLASLPVWQQSLAVASLMGGFSAIQWLIQCQLGLSGPLWWLLSPGFAGFVIWPLLMNSLRALVSRR